jgi:hypothetical protein
MQSGTSSDRTEKSRPSTRLRQIADLCYGIGPFQQANARLTWVSKKCLTIQIFSKYISCRQYNRRKRSAFAKSRIKLFMNRRFENQSWPSKRISTSTLMKHFLLRCLAALACFGLFSLPWAFATTKPDHLDKPNFGGIWTRDLKASTSLEPLMKEVGASVLERKFAGWVNLTATFRQTTRFS